MPFSWSSPRLTHPRAAAAQLAAQRREVSDRAALFYRLGFTVEQATARLVGEVAWELEGTPRPDGLSDAAITELVRQTFARRPSL